MNRIRLSLLVLLVVGCTTNPITGRSQLIVIDRATEMRMGLQAYQEMLGKEQVAYDPDYVEPVERVARRLAETVEQGWEGKVEPPRFEWDVRVIDSPKTLNAWCLPGGKMAVYTGIFPVMHDENGLAVVMGHEIMHAVLHHGVERMSQGLLAQIGVTVLTEVLGGDDVKMKEELYAALGLVVTGLVILPFSREHETEADEYGLYLAAKAGYDPRAGIEVWERMEKLSGSGGPEFLSTHPSHGTRIENMKRWMPKALAYYEASTKQEASALPGASGVRRHRPTREMTAGVRTGRSQHASFDGKPGAAFEFDLKNPVYLVDVLVDGPQGVNTKIAANCPVDAGVRRYVNVWRMNPNDPALPSGRWAITFRGRVCGQEFSERVEYDLD